MAKLVDALCSGRSARKGVLVRIQFWARKKVVDQISTTFFISTSVKDPRFFSAFLTIYDTQLAPTMTLGLFTLPCYRGGNISKIDRQNIFSLNPSNYWRIKYQANNGNITERTIHSPEIIDVVDSQMNTDNSVPQTFVKAFCMLREAPRHFKLDGIKEIVELNIAYTSSNTPDILIDQKGPIAHEAQETPMS